MKKTITVIFLLALLSPYELFAQNGIPQDKASETLTKTTNKISEWLRNLGDDLGSAARELKRIDFSAPEARIILKGLTIARPYIVDCAIVDNKGTMVTIEPAEHRNYEGADISSQEQIVKLHKTKMPVMSKVFRSVENTYSVDIEYPILSSDGEFLGSVSALIEQDVFLNTILSTLYKKLPYKVIVMQTDGVMLYNPNPNQINRNILTDDMFKSSPTLLELYKRAAAEKSGSGTYEYYAEAPNDMTVVKKDAIWDTVTFYDAEWRVIVIEIEK